MKLLDLYLGKRVLFTTLKTMLAMVLLVIVVDFLTRTHDSADKYQTPWPMIGLYYLCLIPAILFEYHAAAMSILVAGLLTLGKAVQDREVTAALAGGVSLRRLVRAPLCIALLLAITALFTGEAVGPRAAQTIRWLGDEYFSRYTGGNRAGASWAHLGGGWVCHVFKFNRTALSGENVYLHNLDKDEIQEIRAGRIYWDSETQRWLIENGIWCKLYPKQEWAQSVTRITQVPAPFSETPDDLFALEVASSEKTASELARDLHRAEQLGVPTNGLWVDYHVKYARPALCFIMMLLAIPFSMRLKQGGRSAGLGLSVAIAIAYVLLFFATVGLGHLGKMPPVLAAWTANLIFFTAGVGLLWRTPT